MVHAVRKFQYVTQIQAETINEQPNAIISDVSVKSGGMNLGMDPHRLIESSLAACTSMTIQMYANHKQIPLLGADVEVFIETEGLQTVFQRKISFRGDLTAEQKTKLIEIANKCPIHKLLLSQIAINTKEANSTI